MSTVFSSDDLPGLPDSVLEAAEFAPVEDVVVPIIRAALPGARIYTEIPEKGVFPYALVRVTPTERWWSGDDRFVDWAVVFVHVFTEGNNADRAAAIFSEAIRVALRDAWRDQVVTEHGSIASYQMANRPTRRSDWATSVGPVQYANLPTSTVRYETMYTLQIRRPLS